MISWSSPMSRKTCGWSNGGIAPTHMNSRAPISITGDARIVVEMGNDRGRP